jgi:uncharacterized damage-inducible protein DinB
MPNTSLTSLFKFKAWSNAQLFAALAELPAERAEQLHSCLRTLNHIYVVDRIFRAHLAGEPRPFDATNTNATPSVDQLQRDAASTDAWYVDHVSNANAETLAQVLDFSFTDGDAGRMSREEMLLHVITHGGYHRGNVGQVLKSIAIAPPRELYTTFLHSSEPGRRVA